jgi:hypothetical protein
VSRWKSSTIQSLLFDASEWSTARAKTWARRHGYRHGDARLEGRFVHIRQHDPGRGRAHRTITLGKGIEAVIEQVGR